MAEKKEPRAAPARSSRSRDASESLTARLARCYTGAVHDVLREMGHEKVVLPAAIKPLVPEMRIAGPAWTVAGHIDLTLSRHETQGHDSNLIASSRAARQILPASATTPVG